MCGRSQMVNNHGGFGRWDFIEITDPWNAKNEILATLKALVYKVADIL